MDVDAEDETEAAAPAEEAAPEAAEAPEAPIGEETKEDLTKILEEVAQELSLIHI